MDSRFGGHALDEDSSVLQAADLQGHCDGGGQAQAALDFVQKSIGAGIDELLHVGQGRGTSGGTHAAQARPSGCVARDLRFHLLGHGVQEALDAHGPEGRIGVGRQALGHALSELGAGFQSRQQLVRRKHFGQDVAAQLRGAERLVHVGQKPLPTSAGGARTPELPVVRPTGILTPGFGGDEVDEALNVDPGFDDCPSGRFVEVVRLGKLEEF